MIRKKLKKNMALMLVFSLIMTNPGPDSWAAENLGSVENRSVYCLDGGDISASARDAVLYDMDKTITREDAELLGIPLTDDQSLYEFNGEILDSSLVEDNTDLRMFIRANSGSHEELSGKEDVIFLFANQGDGKVSFELDIDGRYTSVISVDGVSWDDEQENAAVIGGDSLMKGAESEDETDHLTNLEEEKSKAYDSLENMLELRNPGEEEENQHVSVQKSEQENGLLPGRIIADEDEMKVPDINPQGSGSRQSKVVESSSIKVGDFTGRLYQEKTFEGSRVRALAIPLTQIGTIDDLNYASASNAVLLVTHAYPDEKEEDGYSRSTETFRDIPVGTEVKGLDYASPSDAWLVGRMEPDKLKMKDGKNEITIYYQNVDGELMKMLRSGGLGGALDVTGTAINPGDVKAIKTAEWTDYDSRKATITLTAKSLPVYRGVDVLLIIDQTGSMTRDFKDMTTMTEDEKKINVLKDHAHEFVRDLLKDNKAEGKEENNRIAIWGFCGEKNFPMISPYNENGQFGNLDRDPLNFMDTYTNSAENAITGLIRDTLKWNANGTYYGSVLGYAYDKLVEKTKAEETEDENRLTYVVFMTDGKPNTPISSGAPDYENEYETAFGFKTATKINQSYPIITVGVGSETTGDNSPSMSYYLNRIAYGFDEESEQDNPYYLSALKPVELHESLQRILTKTVGAASNIIITDIVAAEFEVDEVLLKQWYPEKTPVVKVNADKTTTVIWNIGALMSAKESIEIPIVMKDTVKDMPGIYNTNTDVNMTYSDVQSDNQLTPKDEIGDPVLPVLGATITIRYYLVNKDGEYISSNNTVVGDNEQEFRHMLFEESITVQDPGSGGETTLLPALSDQVTEYKYTPKSSYTDTDSKNYSLYGDTVTEKSYGVKNGNNIIKEFKMVSKEKPNKKLKIISLGNTWVYDGTTYTLPECRFEGLDISHSISGVMAIGAITNVGNTDNTISYDQMEIRDSLGEDITNQYSIETETGKLVVSTRSLKLVADSATELYIPGKILQASGVTVSSETPLPDGWTMTATAIGKLTEINELGIKNPVDQSTIEIRDKKGQKIDLSNFDITSEDGTLKMMAPTELIITPSGNTWGYDGQVHIQTAFTQTGLKPNHHINPDTIIPLVSVKDVTDGTVKNQFDITKIKIVDNDGIDVTDQYSIKMEPGDSLNVTARRLVLKADSATETYSEGKILRATGVTAAEGTSLAKGQTLIANANGSLSEVNVAGVANPVDRSSVKIFEGANEVTKNYAIEYRDGLLIMEPEESGTGGGADDESTQDSTQESTTQGIVESTIQPTTGSSGSGGGGSGGGGGNRPGGGGSGGGNGEGPGPGNPTSSSASPTDPSTGQPGQPGQPTQPSQPVNPDSPTTWPDADRENPVTPPTERLPDGSTTVVVPDVPPQRDVIISNSNNDVVYRGKTDENGNINVQLEPGEYHLIAIDDEGVPLANMMFTIEDEGTPLAGLPKTGEDWEKEYRFMMSVFLFSGAWITIGKKKKRAKRKVNA